MQLLTIRQAASRCALSPRMIRKLITMTKLPAVRIGRCVRLREDDLEALIRAGYMPMRDTETSLKQTGQRPGSNRSPSNAPTEVKNG
jgi:excisionase family DNA binding protein